jgi:hypothetical protein
MCTGREIAHAIADVAQRVYHSARTWGAQLGDAAPRPNLERLPMLARLGSDGSAHFAGGRSVASIDAVVYCTGYRYQYPFLERTGLLSTGENDSGPHCTWPCMWPLTSAARIHANLAVGALRLRGMLAAYHRCCPGTKVVV